MHATTADHAVREFSRLRLTLREELKFAPQTAGNDVFYVIEDPVNSKFHRVGLAEYAFVSLLDGKTSVADALRLAAKASPDYAMTEQQAAVVCKWLVQSRLAYAQESDHALSASDDGQPAEKKWQRFNPVSARIPLGCPDRLFDQVAKWFGWSHSTYAFAVWAVAVAYAIYLVASRWDRFAIASQGVLAPGNWLAGIACFTTLKFLHEISHGVACRKHGGSIREAGLLFILLMPIPYVDATSSWSFSSKWQRIHVAAAGMYLELFLAAAAVILWEATEPGLLNQMCYNVAITGSVLTLLINANPLMRFDGYYIFADLVEIPNLYSSGQESVKNWAKHWLLGLKTSGSQWSTSRTRVIQIYGACAMVWRVFICVSLAIGASVLLRGAGVALSCLAIGMWVGLPTVRLLRYLAKGDQGRRPNFVRLGAAAGAGTAALGTIFFVTPWPGSVTAPAVVEYSPLTVIRAASPGFVRDICVRSGQPVKTDQIVAILENHQLTFELAELELEIEQSEIRCRAHQHAQKMADYQAEQERRQGLVKRRDEKRNQVDKLTIRASSDGKIIGRGLEALVGKYVAEGAELLMIGNEQQKQLTMSVPQEEVETFRAYLGRDVKFQLASQGWRDGPLGKIDPQANDELPHPALAAAFGGPLTVRERPRSADEMGVDEDYALIGPRFAGQIELNQQDSVSSFAGQLATVSIRPLDQTIGERIYRVIERWVRSSISARQPADS